MVDEVDFLLRTLRNKLKQIHLYAFQYSMVLCKRIMHNASYKLTLLTPDFGCDF